jgi:hypothetical protein
MEEPKRGRGRPPKPPAEKLERLVLFVPPPVIEKVEKHGKDWARAVLDRAKPPKSE